MIDDIQRGSAPKPSVPPVPPAPPTPPVPKESEELIDLAQPDGRPVEAPVVEAPAEDVPAGVLTDTGAPDKKTPKAKKNRKSLKQWFLGLSKRKRVLFIVGVVLLIALLAGGGYYWYTQTHKPDTVVIINHKKVVVTAKTVASPLSGVQVDPKLAQRPVTGVMIENSPDARPQSALNQAGIVFEAVAEGGITRFLALFQDTTPDYIGPVRSARPYYIDWLLPFDAAYAHVGGSPQAIANIKTLGVKDMDQFYNSAAYVRVSSRAAPHNVYTTTTALDQLEQKKGYTTSSFTSFPRKKESAAKTPTASTIDFSVSAALYNPHYDYIAKDNAYKRSEGGAPHTDEKSSAQIEPKVVVALVTPTGIDADGSHTAYSTTAGGIMYVFQDGTVTQGTWAKAGSKDQFVFKKNDGTTMALNPGQTWITMVGTTGAVIYK